jgi:Ca2+/Na+ antiporter
MKRLRLNGLVIALLVAAVLALVSYFAEVPKNPPGFFVDEASIAYNAHLISVSGADEHDQMWPLFFRAFGEYKSPTYIYLLATLYSITGPGIAVARALSATLGVAAAIILGIVGALSTRSLSHSDENKRRYQQLTIGFAVSFTALVTPWLFEISRLVFEVAMLPLALALFLLVLIRAHYKPNWEWSDSFLVAITLALITYTYSVGRLLAPLLAFGLLLFGGRDGRWWRATFRTWLIYGATLIPLVMFSRSHPGALGSRFGYVSYISPTSSWIDLARRFVGSYAGSFNLWLWLVSGDPEPRHHVQTMGSLLVGTVVLAVIGLVMILVRSRLRTDPWWRFVIYGLAVAPIPSSLTIDHFHTLRLVALPIFLLILMVPALSWLLEVRTRRPILALLLLGIVVQGAVFRWQFHRASPTRWHNFDTFYPEVFQAAIRMPNRPIYLIDNHGAPGYVHAYWYGTLAGIDTSEFLVFPKEQRPPSGALVVSTEWPCGDCQMILERGSFRAYLQK